MGEVYRARDTRLDRDVALKVLPEAFTADPDRLVRFEREAKLLASLNHPNIAAIHGLEDDGDTRALVLELVEGPTLADRIARGPIPVDEALPIATQITEALEAAHERGIIHRDLKPANIKVREDGTVKVLDFGLAKALAAEQDLSQSPTMTATMGGTREGVILGTAAYMSPEQARGKPVDKRTDIWAFGCVLFEMLTGRAAFGRDTLSDTITAVMSADPDWAALPPASPALQRVVRRSLERDPRDRLQHIGDARVELRHARPESEQVDRSGPAVPAGWRLSPVPLLVALAVGSVATLAALWPLTRAVAPAPEVMRFTMSPPPEAALDIHIASLPDLAISPDGRQIVYYGAGLRLHLSQIDTFESRPLIVDGPLGSGPFFAPDGQTVGFVGGLATAIRRVSTSGGQLGAIEMPPDVRIRGASWGEDGNVIAGVSVGGLFSVAAAGGAPETVTTPDPSRGEFSHRWPSIMPGRNVVLFVVAGSGDYVREGRLAALDLDSGTVTPLGLSGTAPRYVRSGHLLFATDDGTLWAVPFDPDKLATTGDPAAVLEGVVVKLAGGVNYSVSDDGRLVYMTGALGGGYPRELVWLDREGREERIPAPPRTYNYPRLSPDGRRVAIDIRDQDHDVWMWDFDRGLLQRFTNDPDQDQYAVWSPDGQQVAFTSLRNSSSGNIYLQAADGTGEPSRATTSSNSHYPLAWSPDGTQLLFADVQSNDGGRPLAVYSLPDGTTSSLFAADGPVFNADVSPDGRWVAYEAGVPGETQIYVRPFSESATGGEILVSADGGSEPVWRKDGGELFYRAGSAMMAVPVDLSGGEFRPGTADVLFEGEYEPARTGRTFDVSADGERFLMVRRAGAPGAAYQPPQIRVVVNWFTELAERVPVN